MSPLPESRLLPLSDGRQGLRGSLQITASVPEATTTPHTLDFVTSDGTLDRYNEIISAAGWRLENYRRNPVLQNAHQYGDVIFTLGRALVTEVRQVDARQALFQRIQFAVDENPVAKIAFALYKGGYLNTTSVGFIPIRWQDGTPTSGFARKYLEQELLEVSAVAIPANPNALALALKSGAVQTADVREAAALLRHLVNAVSTPTLISALAELRDLFRQL